MPANTNEFPENLRLARARLQAWYEAHGRHHLPWRNTADPYAIYVSEVMLQQTQVKTVLERYYQPFLSRFPTLASLAAAPRESVVKAWEGLGYYTRAANLHQAAQAAAPELPATVEELLALPGIGRNTAHAVASFGFGAAVPVMEANVKRVLCRIFALRAPDSKLLWEKAFLLLDAENAFAHNQAMMDIGAMVCTKRHPRCAECPLAMVCEGKAEPESYPEKPVRKAVPVRRRVIVGWRDGEGRYLLRRREGRFLSGLYGFPEYDDNTRKLHWGEDSYRLTEKSRVGAIAQTYSHFTLEAAIYRLTLRAPPAAESGLVAAGLSDMETLALSGADQKVRRLLADWEGR